MTTKLALILTGIWTLLVIIGCSGAIWFVTTLPRHQQEQRSAMLGGSMAIVALVGYAGIALPWAVAFRKRREEQAARAAEDNEEEEDRPRPRKRKR